MAEGPYELPAGWRWVRLGEVCLPTERRDPTRHPSLPFTYVDISAVDNLEGRITSPKRMLGRDAPSRARKVIRSSDVIFATTRPYLKNIALVGPELDGQICSTGFCVLRADPTAAAPRYLYHLCRSDVVVSQLRRRDMRGASYPAVTDRDVYEALIPLPPLAEQRRIVARVERLLARVHEAARLRQQAREETERLLKAVLADTFPRPGTDLPDGWRWVRLGAVAKPVNGFGFPKRYQGRVGGPIPFMKVSDLNTPENDPDVRVAANYVDDITLRAMRARAYEPGTIVFPKIGGAIATNKKRTLGVRAAFDNNIMGLVPRHEHVTSDYLLWLMHSFDLTKLAKVGPVPSIRQSDVADQHIPLPPITQQRRIVAQLEAFRKIIKALQVAQAETDSLLQALNRSILDKAFRGEL